MTVLGETVTDVNAAPISVRVAVCWLEPIAAVTVTF